MNAEEKKEKRKKREKGKKYHGLPITVTVVGVVECLGHCFEHFP
jgi:hypothetical protein